MATVSADALRAGRALIDMSQMTLAKEAGISVPTLRKIEKDQSGVSVDAILKVQQVLEGLGVEFLFETTEAFEGVRRRKRSSKG